MVVAGGVDGELAEELAGAGVDDSDVEFLDQDQDAGSSVGAAEWDVAEPACDAECDGAVLVDPVVSDAVMRAVGRGGAGGCFGQALVASRRGCVVRQRAVRAVLVVVLTKRVDVVLELLQRVGGCRGGEPFLHRLLEPFDFALGLRVSG